ncbi:MAG: trypsin-like peptidase domain-containing protein [Planctomycetota bacterium]
MRQQSAVRQFLVMMVSSLVVVVILIKADIVGRLAYSVEKGRLAALRESLPSPGEMAARFEPDHMMVAAVLPAVVSISTERVLTQADFEGLDPRLHRFFFPDDQENQGESEEDEAEGEGEAGNEAEVGTNGRPSPEEDEPRFLVPRGEGSGFIIDAANGYVVTNSHVVVQATSISVRLADGRRLEARLLGSDPKTDLAVLKIDADRLHELPWGDSLAMEVGDEVFAVGNPFGLEGTVSRGIVSAKNRSNIVLHDIEYQGFLQTDAVINPGNSGGPLVNMRGEVVGINTAIATRSGNYDGIGFAIPAHRVARLVPQLARGEKITRGYLGVQMAGGQLGEDRMHRLGWTGPGGVLIDQIVPDSPASRSELRENDIIVECAGQPVNSAADIIQTVGDTPPDTALAFNVWREGALKTIEVEIGAQPEGFSTRGQRPQRDPE